MHNLLVDRNAYLTRKLAIAQKGTSGPVVLHARRGKLIHLFCGDAWLDEGGNLLQHRTGDRTGRPHRF